MRSSVEHWKDWRRDRRYADSLCVSVLMLAGCAAPTSYMGIDISKPAPAFTLSPEQAAFFRAQNLLYDKAQAAGCIPSKPVDKAADAPVGEGIVEPDAGQRTACRTIALQLVTLEMRRPALALKRSYADMPLTALASEAQGGSKQAQLELASASKRAAAWSGMSARRENSTDRRRAIAAGRSGSIRHPWAMAPAGGQFRLIPDRSGAGWLKRSGGWRGWSECGSNLAAQS